MKNFAIYPTPLGYFRFTHEADKIISILPCSAPTDFGCKNSLTENVYAQFMEYFNGTRKTFDFPYELQGTDFQKKVWNALCEIPYGETRTYKEISIAIGNPKACRAVGMANNKNPIIIAVPCHRVIGSNGSMVGYACGIAMKESLLQLEQEHL